MITQVFSGNFVASSPFDIGLNLVMNVGGWQIAMACLVADQKLIGPNITACSDTLMIDMGMGIGCGLYWNNSLVVGWCCR